MMNSVVGRQVISHGLPFYSATKHAVTALRQAFSMEVSVGRVDNQSVQCQNDTELVCLMLIVK